MVDSQEALCREILLFCLKKKNTINIRNCLVEGKKMTDLARRMSIFLA